MSAHEPMSRCRSSTRPLYRIQHTYTVSPCLAKLLSIFPRLLRLLVLLSMFMLSTVFFPSRPPNTAVHIIAAKSLSAPPCEPRLRSSCTSLHHSTLHLVPEIHYHRNRQPRQQSTAGFSLEQQSWAARQRARPAQDSWGGYHLEQRH